ncbi:serine/threonine-protein kinase [Cellulomonas sp. ICMP 17802]|uniref:serine/threonine-protein kinase n=1 Tax=Cellulomonas sp. ICMP 17802 TaxID=3239199 RepID=UPI00351B4BF3
MLGHVEESRPEPSDGGPATVLDDRYRLDRVLGRGGMATVHQAHDLLLDRDVAVKVFPPVHEDADDLLRNRAEIRVLATLSHPGLVTLHDAGTVYGADDSHQVYLVMELVAGPTLAERLRRGALGPEQTAMVGRDVAEALAVVHAQEIVHRDIKPANVLLTAPDALDDDARSRRPAVKLADFGIARLAGATRLTMTGMTLGTVSYLSPEQATGSALGPASDVYALGLVLLECATGRPAFTGTAAEVATARLTSPPHVPDELGPELSDMLVRMTRLAPEDRPTADEVAAGLSALAGTPSDATLVLPVGELPPTRVAPAVRAEPVAARAGWRARVRSARWAVAAAAVVLLAGGAVLVGQLASGGPDPTAPPSYPAVPGTIGESLTELQGSVEP